MAERTAISILLLAWLVVAMLPGTTLYGQDLSSGAPPGQDLPDPDDQTLSLGERFEALMARAEARQAELVTLEASFEQHKEGVLLLEPETSQGDIAYRAPNLIRWDYSSPATTMIVDDDDMLTWFRDQGFAERRQVDDSAQRVLRLFGPGASLATLRRYFDITTAFPKADDAPYRLDLKPRIRRVERRLKSMTLALDRQHLVPVFVRIEEASGDVTELRFADLRINAELPADRFELGLPDDVEIRDLDAGAPLNDRDR